MLIAVLRAIKDPYVMVRIIASIYNVHGISMVKINSPFHKFLAVVKTI